MGLTSYCKMSIGSTLDGHLSSPIGKEHVDWTHVFKGETCANFKFAFWKRFCTSTLDMAGVLRDNDDTVCVTLTA